MAIPKVKATYSLDAETVALLERVSRRWGVSKSEALRRAIRASAIVANDHGRDWAIEVLDRLQQTAELDRSDATRWQRQVRAGRRAERRG